MKSIKIGTRGSQLALKQSEMLVEYLSARLDNVSFEIVPIKTSGDKNLNWSLEKTGGKGLFTKEIEDELLAKHIDIAVHSAKDLPTDLNIEIPIAGYMPRDNSHDVIIIRENITVPSLIATGSPRRRSQLKKMFPSAVWTEIRGNIETRLQKIANGFADATVLSSAGLDRLNILNFNGVIFKELNLKSSVPAVGQGAIAFQCRENDINYFSQCTHKETEYAVSLERHFLKCLGGGCHVAYSAHYESKQQKFHFYHEDAGYQKIDFSNVKNPFALVEDIARGLAEK